MAHDRSSSSITWATSPEVIETAVPTHHILLLEFISITRTVPSWLVRLMLSHTVRTHDSRGRVASRRTSVSSSRQSAGPLWLQQHRYPEASPPPSWYLDGRKTIKLYYTVHVHVCVHCTYTLWDKHGDSNYPKSLKNSLQKLTAQHVLSQSINRRQRHGGTTFPKVKVNQHPAKDGVTLGQITQWTSQMLCTYMYTHSCP